VVASSLARRYAPFLILAAVQVLLVALVPSTGGRDDRGTDLATVGGTATGIDTDGDGVADQVINADGTTSPVAEGTGAGAATSTGGTAGTVAGRTGGGGTGGTAAAAGDKSKCAKDGVRQQDVTLSSPPCVPKFTGDNGGDTYQGVTGEKVTVLRYRPKENAQVNALLRSQGLASTPEEEKAAQDAFAKFFEKRYEFYNRKIDWQWVQGNCEISPPDLPCFRNEVKRLNDQYHPFAVFYTNSTTQAEFFEEWANVGVINIGGWHFNAEFNQRLRPLHYDVFMDGSRTVRNIADYWCKKMQGKPASLAGDPALRVKTRKLGILTQDFPVTRKNATDLYKLVSGEMCGTPADVAEPLYTPSDIAKAQTTADTVAQKFEAEGVTTLVILADPINPTYTTAGCTRQQWYPEHLLAGSGLIDYDLLGRLYEPAQWQNAFGPGHLADPIPFPQSDAARAAADVGVTGIYSGANLLFAYMSLVAAQVQMAGPRLNPTNVEKGLLSLPASGGWERTKNPASVMVKYGPNDYTAIEDSRHTYWSSTAISKIDNKAGAYIALNGGQRWEIGNWPRGEPRQ
jgi:hypothetical protein